MSKPDIHPEEIWPRGSFEGRDAEKRLLALVQEQILWLSYNDTRMKQEEVAGWLAYVMVGR